MKQVIVYKLDEDGHQQVYATFSYKNRKIIMSGDQTFLEKVRQKGIIDPLDSDRPSYPRDGMHFLELLSTNFDSPYLCATSIFECSDDSTPDH